MAGRHVRGSTREREMKSSSTARIATRLRADHLVRGSFFLMVTTGVTAVLGFAFWLLVAHLYSAHQVGLMTSLISATVRLSYVSLFGLNSTVVRFLSKSEDPDRMVSTAVALVFGVGLIVSALYLVGIPLYSPSLEFVRANPGYAISFAIFTAMVSVNLFTDSVFIAKRATQYNIIVDGFIQGGVKLVLPVLFLGIGSYGIFVAYGSAAAIAVIASLGFMYHALHFRARRPRVSALRSALRFSAASYVSSILNLAPIMVLPILVLNQLGAAQAAYYFIAFQIANLLNAVSYAIGESLFAEGSQPDADFHGILRRSARMLLLIQAPAAIAVALASPFILSAFGPGYRHNGATVLTVLALGSLAVAANTWSSFLLKVTRQMPPLIWSNVVYVIVVVGIAATWAHSGLAAVGLAWDIGNLASAAVALVALAHHLRAGAETSR
jgi:O-antigen/teichoic acid export membrane protein